MSREPATISASSQSRLVCRGVQVRDASRYTVPSTNLATRLVESDSTTSSVVGSKASLPIVQNRALPLAELDIASSTDASHAAFHCWIMSAAPNRKLLIIWGSVYTVPPCWILSRIPLV